MSSNGSNSRWNSSDLFLPSIHFNDICTFENVMGVPVAVATIGTIFNIISFVVFMRPALRNVVTTFYYRVLVATDIVTLNMAVWPLVAKFHTTCSQHPYSFIVCRSFFYIMNVAMDTNAWALMIVHVETYRRVAHPHTSKINWTMKVAMFSAFICLVAALLFNIPIFFLPANHIAWESVKFVCHSVVPFVVTLAHNFKTNSLLRLSPSTEQIGCCRLTSMATVIMTLCITNSAFTLPYSVYRLVTSITVDEIVVLPGHMPNDCVLIVAYVILLFGCSIKFMVFRCICFRFSGQCNQQFGCHNTLLLPAGSSDKRKDYSTRSSIRIDSIIYTNPKKYPTPRKEQN